MTKNLRPIVRSNEPFVCCINARTLPFIRPIIPFTTFRRNSSGFSAIELMVTLVVLGILVGIGYPSMQEMIREQRLRSQVNDFVSDFNYSRSEAVKRKETVVICPLNLVAGNPTCGANWMNGWLIYVDSNNNGVLDAAPTDTVLQQHAGTQGLASLTQRNAAGGVIAPTDIRVDITGMANLAAAAPPLPPPGTWTFCDDRGAQVGRRVGISAGGQTRTDKIPGGGVC